MTPILALLTLAPASPVVLEVSVPKQVASGAEIPVVVRAKNVSSRPVTIARPTPPNVPLGVQWKTELLQDGKPVLRDERSSWSGQWASGFRISPKQFVVLQPGESAEIYKDHFKAILPEGRVRETKREDAVAPREPLAPAKYTFRAHLEFARTFKEDGGALTPKFVPESKARYQRAWVGKVDGQTSFRVVDSE